MTEEVAQVVQNTPTIETSAADIVVAPSAPVAEAPIVDTPTAPVVEAEKQPTTILGEGIKEIPQKEEAVKDEKAEVQEEGKQSDEPAPLPTYEAFQLPEGITWEEEQKGEFNKLLGEFERTSKADHAEVQKLGQSLLDRHVADVKNAVELVKKNYEETEKQTRDAWKEAFLKDPDIGGNRQETTVNAALEFIRTHGGDSNQQQEFVDLMNQTGVGNHPAMIRLLANAMGRMAEGKPLPAIKPVLASQSKIEKRYGSL